MFTVLAYTAFRSRHTLGSVYVVEDRHGHLWARFTVNGEVIALERIDDDADDADPTQ